MSIKTADEYNPQSQKVSSLIKGVINYFHFLSDIGCSGFDCSEASLKLIESWGLSLETIDKIRSDVEGCKLCGLCSSRTNIVFGAGNNNARLIFIGRAPSFDDDKKGEPFTGAAGKLFTNILQAMNLTRSDIYLCNIVKCFPPDSRKPMAVEIKTCVSFLKRQIKVINPDFICTLGTTAAQTFLNTTEPLSVLRGKFYDYNGIKVMPTYHPAHLLQNPGDKRAVWEDMKKIVKEYNNPNTQV